jgi:iron(III) transport system substrate-binding protein
MATMRSNPSDRRRYLRPLFTVLGSLFLAGCSRGPEVTVYSAHDREFAEPMLEKFEKETGIKVAVRYDSEANKAVGLYEELLREAPKPRCDVHWNNEILATIRLQQKGILQPYASPAAEPFPAPFKARDHTWTAFAARARVLIVNTDKVKQDQLPRGLWDLTRPEWKGRIVMAKPLFGTTATQAACLFQVWGKAEAEDYYRKLHANGVELVPGNKQVAVAVGRGQYAVGLTDTDDACAELADGKPVTIIYPDGDAAPGSKRGVLFIPNTVAMIKSCPHPAEAQRLIDFLLSPHVEKALALSESRQVPLNPEVKLELPKYLQSPQTVTPLPVDFAQAAEEWTPAQMFLVKEFGLR